MFGGEKRRLQCEAHKGRRRLWPCWVRSDPQCREDRVVKKSYFFLKSVFQSVTNWKCFPLLRETGSELGTNFQRARQKRIKLRIDWVLEIGMEHSKSVSKKNWLSGIFFSEPQFFFSMCIHGSIGALGGVLYDTFTQLPTCLFSYSLMKLVLSKLHFTNSLWD